MEKVRHPLVGALAAAVLLASLWVVPVAAQTNGARLGIGPTMPTTTTVGASNVAVSIAFTNLSDPADGQLIIPANALTLTPSCGSLPTGAVPPCPTPDPGVFALNPTATGRAGSNCAGQTYSVALASAATGEVVFKGPAITLAASNPTSLVGGTCVIDFSVNVTKAPVADADPTTPGIQTYQLAEAAGWHTQQNNTASCCGSSHTTVSPATPTMTTQASAPIALGGTISDTAVLSGGSSPTGTITFSFYPPGDTTCAPPAAFTSPPVAASGPGSYTSAPFTPTATGTYLTVATYGGDHNNAPVTTKCNENGESVVVSAKPAPKPSPSTSVLGAQFSRQPTLPVTGTTLPVGPLSALGVAMALGGMALIRRSRRAP